jgi:hypothetical protein
MRNRWRALAAGCTLRSSAQQHHRSVPLWPNPLVHRRHSTKRRAARRKPDTSARPWRAIQSTPTQSWRAMRLNVPSHVVPYTAIVPSHDSPHANARQQPASQPASICSFLGRRSALGRSGSGRSGQVPGSTRDSTYCLAVGGTARRRTTLARSLVNRYGRPS